MAMSAYGGLWLCLALPALPALCHSARCDAVRDGPRSPIKRGAPGCLGATPRGQPRSDNTNASAASTTMTALRVPRVLAALAAIAVTACRAADADAASPYGKIVPAGSCHNDVSRCVVLMTCAVLAWPSAATGPCYRECVAGESPKTCHFKFVEEIYSTMIVYVSR